MLVLTRVLVRDEEQLQDVLTKRSLGVPSDCWCLIDPATYDDEMRLRLKSMYEEAHGSIATNAENSVTATVILDGSLAFFRIWHIDSEAPLLHSEKCTLSEEPIDASD